MKYYNIFFSSGTCYIGNRNSTTLLALVLIPDFIYFLSGAILLILGCVFVIRKPRATAAAPLTAPTPRKEGDFLGAVCTLYSIPTFCVMASIYYEYNNREDWLDGMKKPALWAFLLRHLMSLFIGVSTVFWIWSMRTITAWRAVLRRVGPRKQLPIKVQAMPVLRYSYNVINNILHILLSEYFDILWMVQIENRLLTFGWFR